MNKRTLASLSALLVVTAAGDNPRRVEVSSRRLGLRLFSLRPGVVAPAE